MSEINDKPSSAPPPGVPLDQTTAPIYYQGSDMGLGIVWLWRRVRNSIRRRFER